MCRSLSALRLVRFLSWPPSIGRAICPSLLFARLVVHEKRVRRWVWQPVWRVSSQDEDFNMELRHQWSLQTQSQTRTMRFATVAFYGFGLGLLAVGLRELLTGFEENRCSMTYMFEYPEYRVSSQANYFTDTSYTPRELACSIPHRCPRFPTEATECRYY